MIGLLPRNNRAALWFHALGRPVIAHCHHHRNRDDRQWPPSAHHCYSHRYSATNASTNATATTSTLIIIHTTTAVAAAAAAATDYATNPQVFCQNLAVALAHRRSWLLTFPSSLFVTQLHNLLPLPVGLAGGSVSSAPQDCHCWRRCELG